MSRKPNNLSSDLLGMEKLTIDAIIGITDIVESMHQTISSSAGMFAVPEQKRTKGITGMVYRNIRTISKLVGYGIDVPLGQLSTMLGEKESSPRREALISALNGVLGDHLVARDNPLAIPMQLRHSGKPMNQQALAEAIQQANGRIAILVHGICMNDLQWNRQGHDHGAALARDLGFMPLYLHYNTGLHISENGRNFANLLETVRVQSSHPLELFILAHSMGGLVARSACHYGKTAGHA